jgi:hypothetical protein
MQAYDSGPDVEVLALLRPQRKAREELDNPLATRTITDAQHAHGLTVTVTLGPTVIEASDAENPTY